MVEKVHSYKHLRVYQMAMDAAMEIFQLTKSCPREERYALIDQVRRSSRSVCANLAEAWRKRRYRAAFIARLSDAETEACETQVHLEFSLRCNYLDQETVRQIDDVYDHIISQIIRMIDTADKWTLKQK